MVITLTPFERGLEVFRDSAPENVKKVTRTLSISDTVQSEWEYARLTVVVGQDFGCSDDNGTRDTSAISVAVSLTGRAGRKDKRFAGSRCRPGRRGIERQVDRGERSVKNGERCDRVSHNKAVLLCDVSYYVMNN